MFHADALGLGGGVMGGFKIHDLATVGGGLSSTGNGSADRAEADFTVSTAMVFSWGGPSLILGTSTYMNGNGDARMGLDAGYGGPVIFPGLFSDIRGRLGYNLKSDNIEPGLFGRFAVLVPMEYTFLAGVEAGVRDLSNPLGSMTATLFIGGSFSILSGN